MKKLSLAILALALCLGVIMAGPASAADPIKVGILGPFTGPLAHNASEMKMGMLLALDKVNAGGGINGRPVELIFADTSCKPANGVAAVKKLLTRDEVLVVGGGYCSSVNIATSEICQFEKTPNAVGIAISPTITNRGYEYVFRTCNESSQAIAGSIAWLKEVKRPKTVAFFMENSDYGRDAQKIWEEVCKKEGFKILGSYYFEIGDSDFTTQISNLKKLNPELVFNIASTTEAALIQKQAKELNYVTQWMGAGGHFTQAYFKMTGSVSEYAMGCSMEPTKSMKDPLVAVFVKEYEKKFPGSRPGIFSSQGYDNLMVIADAIKRAGKLGDDLQENRDKVRDALKTTNMTLTQGNIKFGKNGQVHALLAPVLQVKLNKACQPDTEVVFPLDKAAAKYEVPKPWSERRCK
ncbi:MAG: ABC transporter substrate-binding protein [Desulfarculaceae bacterium]|nr:ABC transporter substrate-binding protein [Desulfarculaceae bacterium]